MDPLARLDDKAPLAYEESKRFASHGDKQVRIRLARRRDLRPEILYFLAEDASPEVRRVVAANPATPAQADALLTHDSDESVRGELAEKVANLVPGIALEDQEKLGSATLEALERLAQDEAVRIRALIAETLKDVAGAPPHVIRRLARDRSLSVAQPVLRYSPVLTTDDLLEIIASSPIDGALKSIAGRSSVEEAVSDAVAASNDIDAISELLGNPNAQIREATLDAIVDQAEDIVMWHAPLVKRPRLSNRTALKVARFVANDLLSEMLDRIDLDAETLSQVRETLDRRLSEGQGEADEADGEETALEEAKRLGRDGKLDGQAIVAAIDRRDRPLVRAFLAVKIGLDPDMVDKIFAAKAARAIVALAWAADLNARVAERLQLDVASLGIRDHIEALDEQGLEWPMSPEEARQELIVYADLTGVMLPEGLSFPDHRSLSQRKRPK
ncbi:MAG: DUF2336 domain-containing protein [Rhodospirillales bacterium]